MRLATSLGESQLGRLRDVQGATYQAALLLASWQLARGPFSRVAIPETVDPTAQAHQEHP
jgi:hypothetical protein